MMRSRFSSYLRVLIVIAIFGISLVPARAVEVPRISIDELRTMLGNPDVLIIDVRAPGSWEASERKISGAIREGPKDVESWAEKYRKDMTVVLY
jgi:hypothetical protein